MYQREALDCLQLRDVAASEVNFRIQYMRPVYGFPLLLHMGLDIVVCMWS
jgi:hypothetical protein